MPLIVLSAIDVETHKVRALRAGADDYLTKPFGPQELVARLHAALRRASPTIEEPTVEVGDIETLRVHIATLRRKLASAGGMPLIDTHHGAGYRFTDRRAETSPKTRHLVSETHPLALADEGPDRTAAVTRQHDGSVDGYGHSGADARSEPADRRGGEAHAAVRLRLAERASEQITSVDRDLARSSHRVSPVPLA